jgi:HD-GYP domain-containing protein (c-di-GMP phosphodiesterase class II)
MLHVDKKKNSYIDYNRFEKLLSDLSRLVHLDIDIMDRNGEIMVQTCKESFGEACDKKKREPYWCQGECAMLFQYVEMSGNAELRKCHDNTDIIGIPITCGSDQHLDGVLIACSKMAKGTIQGEVKEFLEELTFTISSDIQKQIEICECTMELSERYEELNLIYDIGEKLGEACNLQESIMHIIGEAKDTFCADLVLTSIPGDIMFDLNYDNGVSLPEDICNKSFLNRTDAAINNKLRSGSAGCGSIVLNDTRNDKHLAQITDFPATLLAVPINLKGDISGFLSIINFDQKKSFHTGDVRLAEALAHQISLSLTNAELYDDLKDFLLNVIITLVHSIEAKDYYTKGHSERVSDISLMIASNMGLSAEEQEELGWAAMLHDIGKLGVPEKVLTKQGALDKSELSWIKEHPERGYRILRPIKQLAQALGGIHHHHENFDGTGYPSGLKGKEIPLYARIISVADTYDAMTSTRSYRDSMSHIKSIEEMLTVKGSQLDPDIVDIFVNRVADSLRDYELVSKK